MRLPCLQGLRCRHGAVVLGRRLRLVIEGQLPALGGATEKRKNGDGHGEGEWEGELGEGERMPVEAEVLTREEWRDLARVSTLPSTFVLLRMYCCEFFALTPLKP